MIEAILFDLDGTLLDRERSLNRFLDHQHERLPALKHIAKDLYVSRFIELDAHGHVWKDIVYQTLTSELAITGQTWEQLLMDFETQFAPSCVPFPELHPTLGALRGLGYRLGVISNGRTSFQLRAIEALKIAPFFEVVLISEAAGLRKPDPEIFHNALQKMNLIPQQSIFVGDHPVADVEGARAAGMRAVWMQNRVWPAPEEMDGRIQGLEELPALVEALAWKK